MWTHELHLWHHATDQDEADFLNRNLPKDVTKELHLGYHHRLMKPPEHRFHEHRTKNQFLSDPSRWKRA
eukprot:5742237-Heterocapsa_arctica.AAC.1